MKNGMKYILSLIIFTISCDEITENQIAQSPTGILSFSSYEQFSTITNKIPSLSQQELDSWEKENSFKSYRSVLIDADKEWETVDSDDKQSVFLEKYKDVLSIQDSSLVPHVKIWLYQAIINRQGIYRTGDHFHKIVGEFIVTVKKEDYNKLESLKFINDQPMEMDGIRVRQYTGDSRINKNTRTAATCSGTPYNKEAEYFLSASKCKDGRKAYIAALSFMSLFTGYGDFNGTWRYGDFYQACVQISAWGKIRQSITCAWGNYPTQLEWRSINLTLLVPVVTGYAANNSIFTYQSITVNEPNFNSDSDGGDTSLAKKYYYHGSVIFNSQPSYSSFSNIYAEGKSRGVGNIWAIIYCP